MTFILKLLIKWIVLTDVLKTLCDKLMLLNNGLLTEGAPVGGGKNRGTKEKELSILK